MSDDQQQQQQQGGEKPWYDGADADTIGYLQNRGLDKKTPGEAAFAAIKAHRAAEAHMGIPADLIARLPKDASDEAGRKAFYAKIGVPNDAKEYDFSGIKFADGTDLDVGFTDALRAAFQENGVPKANAPTIAKSFVKYLDDQKTGQATIDAGKMAAEAAELERSWGANLKPNTFIANQAAEKLGLGKDVLDTLAKTLGRVPVAQALLKMGQMMGEDKYVNGGGQQGGAMTREQPAPRMNELMADTAWAERLSNGDTRAKAEFDGLTRLMTAA